MKIIIEGNPKEIAALVQELQERQCETVASGDLIVRKSDVVLCAQDGIKHE